MPEVWIDPLFVEIGSKLTPVDQKSCQGHDVMVPRIPHTILLFVLSRVMDKIEYLRVGRT